MTRIPTIGFSAFLRLICQNERPQKSAIKDRHKPEKKRSYDFHKSMRRAVQKISSGTASVDEVLAYLNGIKKAPERKSAINGVTRFVEWKNNHPGEIEFCNPVVFTSPKGLFKVQFQADLLIQLSGRRTAVHVWNTKSKLSRNLVGAALSLVAKNCPLENRPDDFAVLSLQDDSLYRWSDNPSGYIASAESLMAHIDRLCEIARRDFGLPSLPGQPDHPIQP